MGILSSFLGGSGGGGFIGNFFDNFGFGGSSDSGSGSSSGGLATRVLTSPAFWMAGALVVVVLIK